MSAVETQPGAAGEPHGGPDEVPAPQACPRCGAAVSPDQDWCLECGEAVTTSVARSPGWRLPAAIVGTVVALAAAVLVLAFLELSDDADRAASEPAPSPTPVAEVTPTPTPAATPAPEEPTPVPEEPTPVPGAGEVASWPEGEEAWTVVLLSSTGRAEADRRAQELVDAGTPAGVLRSDDYPSLNPGYWVVFSGQYETREEAQTAAEGIGAQAAGAYARFVGPA